jgi:hypothetical protein
MEIRIRKIIFIVYSDNEIVIYKSITNNVKKSCIKVIYLVLYALKTIRNNDSTDDLHTRQIDIPETRYPKEVKDATDVLSLFLKGEVLLDFPSDLYISKQT